MTTGDADGRAEPVQRSRAVDLEEYEGAVARLFGALERHDAPSAVCSVLGADRGRPAPRLLRRVPLGAWGLASAALLLLSLGAAAFVELTDPGPQIASEAAAGRLRGMTIVEDSSMALFHDVETFDDVGRAPGRLLADWGR